MQSPYLMNINRLAVRPPEYFPRLAYLALMQAVDVFVVADTFQYSRQSFQNRTRVRTPQGWSWLSVPLKGRQHGLPIYKTIIDNQVAWESKHRRGLEFNYRQTPFYDFYERDVASFFENRWTTLGDLATDSLILIREMYGLKCEMVRASALPGAPGTLSSIIECFDFSELLVGADTYEQDASVVSSAWRLEFDEPTYRQHFEGHVAQLSGLDLFFNYGPETSNMLRTGVQTGS